MSNTALIQSIETEMIALQSGIMLKLSNLKTDLVDAARMGANLQDFVNAWHENASPSSPEEAANKLHSLGLQDHVLAFAKRAAAAKRRGLLEDPAQLLFAFAGEPAEATSITPVSHANDPVMKTISQCTRIRQFFDEWTKRQPVEKWDEAVKRSVKQQLQPMVELFEKL